MGKLGGKWHCSQNPVIRFPPQGDPLILCTWFAWILEEEVTLGHLSDMFANVLSGSFEDWGIVERGFSDSSFGALSVRPPTLKEGNYGSQRPGKRQSINVVIRKWASIYCLIKRIQYMHLIKVPCSKDFCFLFHRNFSFDVCPMEILVLVFTPWEFQVLISISSGGCTKESREPNHILCSQNCPALRIWFWNIFSNAAFPACTESSLWSSPKTGQQECNVMCTFQSTLLYCKNA